jgi:poly(3-hydroxybutyrate) depolymerase
MIRIIAFVIVFFPLLGFSQSTLDSATNITITKVWSQQPAGYTYPISVYVPNGPVPPDGFPVCILLHGNGSQNPNPIGPSMIFQFKNTLPCHILVAPTGYQNSWNICAENSNAPDVEMIHDLVNLLQSYTNVNPAQIRILGTSNGAGLANRVYIENTNLGIDIVCAVVSHLNESQYHSGNFYQPSGSTDSASPFCGYDVVAGPLNTRKYLSISNINDSLIPYLGGISNVGVTFLPAETAAHIIAMQKGYTGGLLTSGNTIGNPAITEFSYLSGEVVHIKGNAAHTANATQKSYITDYFDDCNFALGISKATSFEFGVYPNPSAGLFELEVNTVFLGQNYSVFDPSGKALLTGKIQSLITKLDLSQLAGGNYFLRVGANGKQVLKVIK